MVAEKKNCEERNILNGLSNPTEKWLSGLKR